MINYQTQELLELVEKYPELPVVPMVWYEVVCGDEYAYWVGNLDSVRVTKYYKSELKYDDGRLYFWEDRDDLFDKILDIMCDKQCIEEIPDGDVEQRIENLDWIDCIAMFIGLPE